MKFVVAGASLAALCIAAPALAQSSAAQPGKDIVVTAHALPSERDVLAGATIIGGEELVRNLQPTIGETLARQPGVSATSFGPSASRPILRGFQGERVRVLTDGIGSIDVSNTSVDHAVVVDPLLSERVEVLRGPTALLFGPFAVGGVVNVIDTRIPRSVPADGYRLNAIAGYGSAANERSIAGASDVAVGKHLVLHADGSYLKSDDLHVGGYVLSPQARAAALASAAAYPNDPIDFAAAANLKGTLPNTAAETWTAGAGATLITDSGSLGVSYSHYDSLYGVPIRFATAPGQAQEAPRLDIVQNRYDLRGEIDAHGGFIDQIRLRFGHANYRHFELDRSGAIGTAFYNNGTEARLEVAQTKRGAWEGTSGAQVFNRLFDVEGDEAFLPRSESNQVALFTLQQFDWGALKAESSVRYEHNDVAARTPSDDQRFFHGGRSYNSVSASAGASYGFATGWRLEMDASHTERSPSAEELFANGPHGGTEAYELGNPDFRLEKSWGLEATLHHHTSGFNLDASAYYDWFSNYIYDNQVARSVCAAAAAPSGRTVDLPCFQYRQADARYYGFEVDGSLRLATIGAWTINGDLLGDYVHATIVDQGPVPRIPPLRLLGGVEAQGDKLNGRIEVEHVFDQDRIADFETPTSGYTMVNATVGITPWRDNKTSLLLSANNIFDVDARRHSSVLKDFAPLAGRDIRVTLKFGI